MEGQIAAGLALGRLLGEIGLSLLIVEAQRSWLRQEIREIASAPSMRPLGELLSERRKTA
ncbi:MAG TPA: hypothetical protein VNL15_06205 [Dehalococcoidia bacterium]|nr:hypothetical protein [Dehalococcoidia bacterium]